MGLIIPDGMESDHEDRNPLNDQRENLKIVTKSQNKHNRNLFKNSTTGVSGITFNKRRNKYIVHGCVDRIRMHIGSFNTIEEAVTARKNWEKRYVT